MGGIESYKKTVMRAVRLFNNACGEQIGEQTGGEQITVLICMRSKVWLAVDVMRHTAASPVQEMH